MDETPAVTIEASGLVKVLGRDKALDAVGFSLQAGQIACLLGPNGSGKTTLLKILSTLILPDAGTARVLGCDVVREAAYVRPLIGLHSGDERSFYGRLSTRENLLFFGSLYGLSGAALRRRIEELAVLLDMGGYLTKRYHELSTGMKERVLLARALIHDPPVLLLDEPTQGLDPVAADRLLSGILLPLARDRRKTVLMATHHLAEAERAADQVIVMSRGKVVLSEGRAGFRSKLAGRELLEFMRSLDGGPR